MGITMRPLRRSTAKSTTPSLGATRMMTIPFPRSCRLINGICPLSCEQVLSIFTRGLLKALFAQARSCERGFRQALSEQARPGHNDPGHEASCLDEPGQDISSYDGSGHVPSDEEGDPSTTRAIMEKCEIFDEIEEKLFLQTTAPSHPSELVNGFPRSTTGITMNFFIPKPRIIGNFPLPPPAVSPAVLFLSQRTRAFQLH